MKKLLAFLLVAVMVLGLAACSTPSAPASESADPAAPAEEAAASSGNVIKIGVYEPASGDNGAGGKQETLGIQYANSVCPTVEVGGTTYDVELVIVDNESSNDKGPTAAASLVSSGVTIALGSYGSGVSIAASDVFGNAGIPIIGVTCTNPQVTEGNEHYFRICFLDPFQGTVLANFAAENFQAKTAYSLAKLGDDYSVGLCNYFNEAFEALGGTVIYETFPEGNSDFTSYLTTAANNGADVFFAPVSTEAAALIIDQASGQGWNKPILAGDTWDSNVILNAAKGKNVQIYVTTFYQEGANPEFDAGVKAWMRSDPRHIKNNGGDVGLAAMTAMGYDAYYVALEAMKKADSINPGDILNALGTVEYEGVSGSIAFDENGDAIRDRAYVKTADTVSGNWKFVVEQTVR